MAEERREKEKMVVRDLLCCAVREIEYLSSMSSAQAAMRKFWLATSAQRNYPPYRIKTALKPFVIFTATTRPLERHKELYQNAATDCEYGPRFKAYILDHNLGPVLESEERQNGTSNWLKVYIWHVDWPKLEALMAPEDEKEHQEDLEKARIEKEAYERKIQQEIERINRLTNPFQGPDMRSVTNR